MPIFLKKMEYKKLSYQKPEDLISDANIHNVKRAWTNSIAHQISNEKLPDASEIIDTVRQLIHKHLPNGQ